MLSCLHFRHRFQNLALFSVPVRLPSNVLAPFTAVPRPVASHALEAGGDYVAAREALERLRLRIRSMFGARPASVDCARRRVLQRCAPYESRSLDLCAFRLCNIDGLQCDAIFERPYVNEGHRRGERKTSQRAASVESTVSDAGD